jgi:CelD/BcsL family acetyltransferase involved in cellulose biosynthesis
VNWPIPGLFRRFLSLNGADMIPFWRKMLNHGGQAAQQGLGPAGALVLNGAAIRPPALSSPGRHDAPASPPLAGQLSRRSIRVMPEMTPASAGVSVELRTLASCRAFLSEWRDLQTRSLEANAFATPELMLAAAQHLPAAQPPAALVVRSTRKLLGIIPLESARLPVLPGALNVYATPYHPVGVPLVDARQAEQVIAQMLEWCAGEARPFTGASGQTLGLAGLIWRKLPLSGPFATLLARIAAASGRELTVLDAYERPVLMPRAAQGDEASHTSSSASHRKNLRRLSRRMAELGALHVVEAASPAAINPALETLMVMEAAGWKGSRGTAMVQNARLSCFIRASMRQMAASREASVMTLMLGETPVAAALMLEQRGVHFCYKIAYDPAFAKLSPGMVLAHEIGLLLQAKPGFIRADSCVDSADSFMARVWPESVPFGDVMLALPGRRTPAVAAMQLRERLRRRLRAGAKRLYYGLNHRLGR